MCLSGVCVCVKKWVQEYQHSPSLWFQQSITFAKNYSFLNLIEALQLNILLLFEDIANVDECGLPNVLKSYISFVTLLLTLPPNTDPSKPILSHHHSSHRELGKNFPHLSNVLKLSYSQLRKCAAWILWLSWLQVYFPPDLSFDVTCPLCVWSVKELVRNFIYSVS